MTKLGTAILVAARDQGWTIAVYARFIALIPPDGAAFQAPAEMFEDARYDLGLRFFLLHLILDGGLQWPWPPDHRENVHGELPRSE